MMEQILEMITTYGLETVAIALITISMKRG